MENSPSDNHSDEFGYINWYLINYLGNKCNILIPEMTLSMIKKFNEPLMVLEWLFIASRYFFQIRPFRVVLIKLQKRTYKID
jgi:hypothetical protein